MAPLLRVEDLRFAYDDSPPVFDGWSAALAPGVALLFGDSGSGKTTLLRVLAGDVAPNAGRIVIAGQALDGDRDGRRRQVCWIDPFSTSFEAITVAAFVDRWRGLDPAFDDADWQRHVDGFGLAAHADKRFEQLSTGTRRKAWIAASLASGAPLVLLDEPTAALDRPSIDHLWRSLADARARTDRLVLVASFSRPPARSFDAVIELPG